MANLEGLAAAGNTFYNYAGQLDCLDTTGSQGGGLDDNGWAVLACNEMAMPFASNPATSMFPPMDWVPVDNTSMCMATYGLEPQYEWALKYYGGLVPKRDFYKTSNIVFSNGWLDPWHAGGLY